MRKLFYSNGESLFIRRKALLIVADHKFDCTFDDRLAFLQFYFLLENDLFAEIQDLHAKSFFKLFVWCWFQYFSNKLKIVRRCEAEESWNRATVFDMLRIDIPSTIDCSLEKEYCLVFSSLI